MSIKQTHGGKFAASKTDGEPFDKATCEAIVAYWEAERAGTERMASAIRAGNKLVIPTLTPRFQE